MSTLNGSTQSSPGARFRAALASERPLQIVGAIHPLAALMAAEAGFRALYLSGAGVANASYGLPDLGMTGIADVETDIRRIVSVTGLPLLVDADTGFGNAFSIGRMMKVFEAAGAAAIHLEDQQTAKRCGHRPNKALVEVDEMCDRIAAAVAARSDPDFFVIARTDALASEGIEAALARARAYVAAGADGIFAEALTRPEEFAAFTRELSAPVLANMTEFGKTPLLNLDQLRELGIAMALYPLSAFRAMNQAADEVYQTIRRDGTQQALLGRMQTRDRLYEVIHYHEYEQALDRLTERNRS